MGFECLWAYVSCFCRRRPPPCCISMQLVGSIKDKMGEGHLPLGDVKTKKGWHNLDATIAILPSSKHSLHRPRLSGRWMKAWPPSEGGEWRTSGMVSHWMRGVESPVESLLATWQSLSSCKEVTWVQAGPFASWKDAWQARGRGPPASIWIIDWRVIGRLGILHWLKSQRDRLTSNPSTSSKTLGQTTH